MPSDVLVMVEERVQTATDGPTLCRPGKGPRVDHAGREDLTGEIGWKALDLLVEILESAT